MKTALWPYYASQGRRVRLYYRLKWRRGNIFELCESFIPKRGRVLDVGCGHGLFTNVCAIASPKREVEGLDLDAERIRSAQATVGDRKNIRFSVGRVEEIVGSDYDAVIVFDVIHHLAREVHAPLFKSIHAMLKPGGVFLLKDIDRRPRWKFFMNYLLDTFNSRLRKFTLGSDLTFRDPSEVQRELEQLGFVVERPALPGKGTCPHALYVCTKR